MTRPEELNPELVPYLVESEVFGLSLKHPLVFAVPYFPRDNARTNAIYKWKKEQLARARRSRDWHNYVFLHERPYRSLGLSQIAWEMAHKDYWVLLATVWYDTENLWQWGELLQELLEADRPGRWRYFMEEADRSRLIKLPTTVTVYRGHSNENRDGWSWTTDHDRALWFARRFGFRASLLTTGTVRKTEITASLLAQGEDELVINPANVKIISTEPVEPYKEST